MLFMNVSFAATPSRIDSQTSCFVPDFMRLLCTTQNWAFADVSLGLMWKSVSIETARELQSSQE